MFALIGKWNNRVQSVNEVSANLSGIENVYEIQTDFIFEFPIIPDAYEYKNSTFEKLTDYPLLLIDRNWSSLYPDYKAARTQLYIAMMTKGGFSNLLLEEKVIASKWFIVGRVERNSVHTVQEQIKNGLIYHENSVEARKHRFNACITEVYNRLDDDQIKAVMIAMDFSKTVYAYIDLGLEGTLEGNPEGLFDYINARANTQFEMTGLKVQNYTPVGYANCSELANRIMDILANGNY